MNASKKTAAKKTTASKAATKKATAKRTTVNRSTKKSSDRYVDLDEQDYRTPDGTRVTEEVAEGITERALRARRGRPSLSTPGTVSPTVNARVSQSTKAALRARADARGVSESDLVRRAVEDYLEHA